MFKPEHAPIGAGPGTFFTMNAVGKPDGLVSNPHSESVILPSELPKIATAVWVVAANGSSFLRLGSCE